MNGLLNCLKASEYDQILWLDGIGVCVYVSPLFYVLIAHLPLWVSATWCLSLFLLLIVYHFVFSAVCLLVSTNSVMFCGASVIFCRFIILTFDTLTTLHCKYLFRILNIRLLLLPISMWYWHIACCWTSLWRIRSSWVDACRRPIFSCWDGEGMTHPTLLWLGLDTGRDT